MTSVYYVSVIVHGIIITGKHVLEVVVNTRFLLDGWRLIPITVSNRVQRHLIPRLLVGFLTQNPVKHVKKRDKA
jgi:hypothetical protein